MTGIAIEGLNAGDTIELGIHRFTAAEIVDFARRYDPQEFHLSEEAAARMHFGALSASGWHTSAAFAACFAETLARPVATRPALQVGPWRNFRDLRWLRPTRAGDMLTFRATLRDVRSIPDQPAWFITNWHCEGINQDKEPVYLVDGEVLLGVSG